MRAENVYLVSLGDSIATGTLTPFSSTHSYVFYLQNKLLKKGYRPYVYQLARDGDTSHHLLWKLRHSPRFRKAVEQADWITVSIGGNDLLRACSIPGFASIHPHMAKQGVKGFAGNWPQIVEEIRGLNQRAGMVVLNLYNPYNHTGYDRHLFEFTDSFLEQINGAIAAYAENRYRIADAYTAFRPFSTGNMHRVTCLYPESIMRNPHPTPGGHRLLADLVLEQFCPPDTPHIAGQSGQYPAHREAAQGSPVA